MNFSSHQIYNEFPSINILNHYIPSLMKYHNIQFNKSLEVDVTTLFIFFDFNSRH